MFTITHNNFIHISIIHWITYLPSAKQFLGINSYDVRVILFTNQVKNSGIIHLIMQTIQYLMILHHVAISSLPYIILEEAIYILVNSKQYPTKILRFVMKLVLQGDLHVLSAKDD